MQCQTNVQKPILTAGRVFFLRVLQSGGGLKLSPRSPVSRGGGSDWNPPREQIPDFPPVVPPGADDDDGDSRDEDDDDDDDDDMHPSAAMQKRPKL
jgi:hypothetical protein